MSSRSASPSVAWARLDCLIGSTADAVGLGDLEKARRRLARAAAAVAGTPEPPWRPGIRLRWVETEVALLGGKFELAAQAATVAVTMAEAQGSPRHLAKSAMFLGVAEALLATARDTPDTSDTPAASPRSTLLRAAALADRYGLLPLIWPVRAVLATMPGLASDAGEAEQHLQGARDAARAIAAGLGERRVERWTARDPMAAFLLSSSAGASADPAARG
jgi:hypothetical protein